MVVISCSTLSIIGTSKLFSLLVKEYSALVVVALFPESEVEPCQRTDPFDDEDVVGDDIEGSSTSLFEGIFESLTIIVGVGVVVVSVEYDNEGGG
jgi:hypothetical protein